jgi:hypothetical protein
MKIKSGKSVINVIRMAYAANKSVLLEGKHGVGKSQLIEQAAEDLGIGFVVRDLSLMEPPDLLGLPKQEKGRTSYSPPSFLPDAGKGLLVFEELNRSEKYMMSPCLQLLTARCLNDYVLPAGWLPVAAINPASDGYDSQELDPALLSRFIRVTVEADAQEFLTWGEKHDLHAAVSRFVRNTPGIFDSPDSNPRAWAWVSELLHAFEREGNSDSGLLLVSVSGLVGDTLGRAFIRSLKKGEDPIDAEQILGNYKQHRQTVQKWAKSKKMDLLNATAHSIRIHLQDSDHCAEIAGSKTMRKSLEDFLSDLPGDLAQKVKAAAKQAGVLK